MNLLKITTTAQNDFVGDCRAARQSGSALVIAVFVLALISVFVALALTRTAIEAAAVGNETAEGRTFYAAQASLELMTRNFNKTFEVKINPSDADLNAVRNAAVPRLSTDYTFRQEVDKTSNSATVVLPGGEFAGLYAIRDNWRLRTTATDYNGVQVQLTRNVLNNRIPIFQFGIFYDDDLELYRPPRFSFGGRVHSNRHFFVSPGGEGIYFDSRVTAVGHIVTQTWRNGYTGDSDNDQTFIKNASGVWKQLLPTKGSVLNTTAGASNNIFASDPDLPPSRLNTSWATDSSIFDGNLQSRVKELKLPLAVGVDTDLVEMVRRGKQIGDLHNKNGFVTAVTPADVDNPVMTSERYANKPGIRISLADSKAKLPGCAAGSGTAAVTGDCGIRLDGDWEGKGNEPDRNDATAWKRSRGYLPLPMVGGYHATRVNGERLYSAGQQVWIKVETVQYNNSTQTVETKDITQEFLSLGVTEQAPPAIAVDDYDETPPGSSLMATTPQPPSNGTDSRSIIKIQRFAIPGPPIPGAPNAYGASNGATKYLYPKSNYNIVMRYTGTILDIDLGCLLGCASKVNDDPNNPSNPNASWENMGHLKKAYHDLLFRAAIVPFPIQMYDTREGTYFDNPSLYTAGRVTQNGVMSMIDIDIANLRRFLRGDFDGLFPGNTPFASANGSTLRKNNIPDNAGWVLYVSDRRGDYDFDGEYDMEDIYGASPGNDGIIQPGEDLQKPGAYGHGILNTDYINEATKYANVWFPDEAAVRDHKFFRRGVRLINGEKIPGVYDAAVSSNTKGFTVASENGIYVQGNYNATGVANKYTTGNTPYNEFLPFNSATHVPASIVADSITILSNNWNDAKSFAYPYDLSQRKATETTVRFAMISGDTIANIQGTPNQGGISPQLNGGVHNFKRFLERWTDPSNSNFRTYLNYSGSLINLFNSRNNNGSFKCCNTVYNPPIRNWVFDTTFLDASRLPPGTPFFQYVQITGFERTND
ncbi:MAG: pilus assembly PilX N-terminal domain-containing protein [Acidobacteriota bacterium]|nr:pilus assembly PilX N-terminal domain-containing protein [Acidobacteriota bacterium]